MTRHAFDSGQSHPTAQTMHRTDGGGTDGTMVPRAQLTRRDPPNPLWSAMMARWLADPA